MGPAMVVNSNGTITQDSSLPAYLPPNQPLIMGSDQPIQSIYITARNEIDMLTNNNIILYENSNTTPYDVV